MNKKNKLLKNIFTIAEYEVNYLSNDQPGTARKIFFSFAGIWTQVLGREFQLLIN